MQDSEAREWRFREGVNAALARQLQRECPEMTRGILDSGEVDIDESFLGFVATYALLSKLIPWSWTVIDLGCCYAAQARYFTQHRAYIGVDLVPLHLRWSFANTSHLVGNIMDALDWCAVNPETTFAICNYVPPWGGFDRRKLGAAFPNLYTFYPA